MNDIKITTKLQEILATLEEYPLKDKDIFNALEAAKFLSLSPAYLYRLTSARLIPHYKGGKKLYFKRSELEAWLLRKKQHTVEELGNLCEGILFKKSKP